MHNMRRFLIVSLVLSIAIGLVPRVVLAQDEQDQTYRSDVLGLAFQYPADWKLREQLATQTVITASQSDLDAVAGGKKPSGLLFSVTISSFRQVGAESLDDFGPILQKIAGPGADKAAPSRIAGTDGLAINTSDTAQDLATRTVLLSIGKRRVAVVRGVATMLGWKNSAQARFDTLTSTLSFFPPANQSEQDTIGSILWQLPADSFTGLTDISINATSSVLYITDHDQGIWKVGANGIADKISKATEIGAFGNIGVLRDGAQYIADPVNHSIWIVGLDGSKARRLLGGQVGIGRGAFGSTSPAAFAFGLEGILYVLDQNDKGWRVQVFNRGGTPIDLWDLSKVQDTPLESPTISSDRYGNAYVVARNANGIIKLNAAGRIVVKDLGKGALANTGPLAITVDRFDNIFVATQDQGILKLSADGKLIGIIGQPYDESAAPKPGQFGKPIAMALSADSTSLYVVDAGKYPQIVAVALVSNIAVSLEAGTKDVGSITYGQTLDGEITAATFMYTYEFTGKTGDVITITMRKDASSNLDTYVDLLGPDGQRLAADDDAKAPDLSPTDAQIKEFKLPVKGTYTIRATRFGRETTTNTGKFSLSLDLVK